MIQSNSKPSSRFFLLSLATIANDSEDCISSIGYQKVEPRQDYPVKVIPRRYNFDMNRGRRLAEYQLVYITGGSGFFTDNDGSKIITPGNLILLRPGYWHSYHPNKDIGWTEYYIGFNGPTFRKCISKFFNDWKGPVEIGLSAQLVDLYEQALYFAERQCSETMPMLQSIVIHMLSLINYNLSTVGRNDDNIIKAINHVKWHMANHISEDVDVKSIASEMGMSYTWLRRMFRKNTGMAPAQYMRQLRIHTSMYFLRNTSQPIKYIALDCGFKTPEYYCSAFQKETGMTPSEYRNDYGDNYNDDK